VGGAKNSYQIAFIQNTIIFMLFFAMKREFMTYNIRKDRQLRRGG